MTPTRLALAFALVLTACEPSPEAPTDDAPTVVADEAPTADLISEPAAQFDVNTATEEQLASIPGVGDRMVHEFEEYRPYASIREFRQEIGKYVDDETVAGYEEYLFVPVDANASDVETMMQLPGVSAEEAQALVDGRPYASQDAFLTAYESIAGAPDAAAATVYLLDLE